MLEDGSVKVVVVYGGPAVNAGRMDARELAPAMLATAHLFEHTASLLYGSASGVKIEVNADFQRGSFAYELVARALEVTSTLMGNLSISDVVAVGALAIGTVRWLRGRTPARIDRGPEQATIIMHEGDSITVNIQVAQVIMNTTIRADLEGIVEPLKRPGIDDFRLESGVAPTQTVVRDEVDYFRAPTVADELLLDEEVTDVVQVVAPYFAPGHKWEFALAGGERFWARIADGKFLKAVARHEVSFGAGDALKVRMKFRVTRTADGAFDRAREIIEVLEIIPPRNDQISLLQE